jgi:F-type H+-transporting ATPase subunit b
MTTQLPHIAASTSGISSLGVNGKELIIQLVTFGLAYLVLRKYAFGPILKIMQQRRETIEQGVRLGEKMKQDEAELEKQVEKILHESRAQADKIISEAEAAAKAKVKESEDDAKNKAAGILKSAEDRIEQETARAKAGLKNEMINLVANTTEAILKEKVDAKKDGDLIKRALAEQEA